MVKDQIKLEFKKGFKFENLMNFKFLLPKNSKKALYFEDYVLPITKKISVELQGQHWKS